MKIYPKDQTMSDMLSGPVSGIWDFGMPYLRQQQQQFVMVKAPVILLESQKKVNVHPQGMLVPDPKRNPIFLWLGNQFLIINPIELDIESDSWGNQLWYVSLKIC